MTTEDDRSARPRWGIRRLVAINKRLADPRGLSEAEARKLALEGRAFYAQAEDFAVGTNPLSP